MGTPTRILVLEDNRANLDLMVYLLDAFGYTAFSAMDGEEGVHVAHREQPKLILCDIDLPKLDGYGVLQKLKSESEFFHVPIVAVTALAMVGDRDKILKRGFNGYICKPITPETFIDQIEKFIAPGLRANRPSMSITASDTTVFEMPPAVEKNATILVVDDVPNNLGFARSIFVPSGYRVLTASNVHDAITLAKVSETDLILCDLNMPLEDGYDLLEQLRSIPRLANVPFIMSSSTHTSAEYGSEAVKRGATCFIARPIDPQILLTKIAAVLESNRKRRDDPNSCRV